MAFGLRVLGPRVWGAGVDWVKHPYRVFGCRASGSRV